MNTFVDLTKMWMINDVNNAFSHFFRQIFRFERLLCLTQFQLHILNSKITVTFHKYFKRKLSALECALVVYFKLLVNILTDIADNINLMK